MNNILDEVKGAKSIGLAGHVRPDGDCVGSCTALYQYLKQYTKANKIDLYLEYIPENLAFLNSADKAVYDCENDFTYDVFIALDSGDLERLGNAGKYFTTAKKTICIDHHITNIRFAEENYIIADASSTAECLFDLMEEDKITESIAASLYTGIIHDTGVFRHSNTKPKTMDIVGKLLKTGIPFSNIINDSYIQKTFIQNQILGRCLLESILLINGKCIASVLTQRILDFYCVTSKDLDGIVNQMLATKGAEVAIFIYEVGTGEFKVSMRAKDKVDVGKIAVIFGGGGHVKAAGCTINGSFHDVINNITRHVEAQLEGLDEA